MSDSPPIPEQPIPPAIPKARKTRTTAPQSTAIPPPANEDLSLPAWERRPVGKRLRRRKGKDDHGERGEQVSEERPATWYGGSERELRRSLRRASGIQKIAERRGKPWNGEGKGSLRRPGGLTIAGQAAVDLAVANPGMSIAKVCRQVGVNRNGSVARRLGANGDLRAHVRALLDKAGLSDTAIIRKWASQVNALETKHFAYQGEVISTRRVVNLDARTDALREVTKLARLYPEAAEEEKSKALGPLALTINLNQMAGDGGQPQAAVQIALGARGAHIDDATGTAASDSAG